MMKLMGGCHKEPLQWHALCDITNGPVHVFVHILQIIILIISGTSSLAGLRQIFFGTLLK